MHIEQIHLPLCKSLCYGMCKLQPIVPILLCVMPVTWPVTGTYELYQLQAKCASEVPSAWLLASPKNVIHLPHVC